LRAPAIFREEYADDLVPAVRALRDHGLRTVNASWRGHGHELAKACWGSFDLDDIARNVVRHSS